jgi:RNA polymerase sigma-70 factor (ECF subfamily)
MAVAADRMTQFRPIITATRASRLTTCYRLVDVSLRALPARETRSIDDAEDLAQEAFLRLWRTREWDHIRSVETLRSLCEVIAQLHPDTRRAFLLHKIENYPHATIAQCMGISVSMVEKHIGRVCKALRAPGVESQRV